MLWSEVDGRSPCGCCTPLEVDDGVWTCRRSGRRWLMVDSPADLPDFTGLPHDTAGCRGSCKRHPLMTAEIARWNRGIQAGQSWGDLWYEEEQERMRQQSEAQRAAERAAKEAELREQEERDRLACEAAAMARKAERVAVRVGVYRKQRSEKIMQPCKFLYNCQGTPARPTTRRVTTECWSHEYTDPETGKRIVKHVCDRMHPGEEGWCKEWDGNPSYRPGEPQNRFAALRGRW